MAPLQAIARYENDVQLTTAAWAEGKIDPARRGAIEMKAVEHGEWRRRPKFQPKLLQ